MMRCEKTTVPEFILRELRDILILIAISTSITFMFAGKQIFTNFHVYYNSIIYGFVVGFTLWKGNQTVGYLLEKKFPWEKNPSKTLFYHISGSIIFTATDIVIVNYLIYRYVFHVNIFEDLERCFRYTIVQFGIAMLITTMFYLKHFFVFWRDSVIQREKYKQDAITMQYETLKSYVNPHFLFNSLSVLSSLVEKDAQKSQEFIKQLSNIYRYVLEQKDKELVLLSTELDFLASYINLHKVRHGDNLKVDLKVDDKSGYVIPLSLQILLENAFKHNIISEDEPLSVIISRENDYIVVQNKLQTRKTISDNEGIGLKTISERYEFFTKRPLVINDADGFFTVKIPVLDLSVLDGYK